MSQFFWYQLTGGESAWVEALAEHRAKVIAEIKPAFVTVLDANSCPDDTWGREEFSKMKYTGPLFFDWDSDNIAETIPPFLEFLTKLEQGGTNLKSLRLYATGGRGFHCEIPEAIFNPKPSKAGVTLLPYIYKEMALELATECMDLRVYTARKGRMWRVPGIVRTNGKYKVSITLDQAMAMTPELYDLLTSKPCDEMYREPPTLSVMLSTLFVKAQNKIEAQSKIRAKSKGDGDLLAKFNGEFPPTVLRLLSGVGVVPGVGFHKIAMQLAITANALGKSSDDLVTMAEGLVQSHESDSSRYNTPRKRKEELRRMWEYTNGNDLYEYSNGGIKSLCEIGSSTADLNTVTESAVTGMVDEDEVDDSLTAETDSVQSSLLEGLVMLKSGVFRRTADGAQMLSNISFSKPNRMVDAEDGMQVGIETMVVSDSRQLSRQLVPLTTFRSRASLNDFCAGRSGIFRGSDTQAAAVQLILSRRAMKDNETTYIVRKEGLDLLQDPTSKEEVKRHTVWVSPSGVLGHTDDVNYRYQPKVSTGSVFDTDLHVASVIQNTQESRDWVAALLTMNNPVIVGQMVGWFVSCFHKQFYHKAYNQFPLLHPNGTAGSGKTQTTTLLAHMFYTTNSVQMMGASHNASSSFSLKAAWTSSASIPVIIDEYKPSELGSTRYDFLLQHFRMLYNQAAGASGGINRGGAESSFRDITQYTYSAPTVYIGESQEMQTAIVQRTVAVGFNPAESKLHTPSFDLAYAEANRYLVPQLGRLILAKSLEETVASRVAALDPIRVGLRATMDKNTHDRQVYNHAVVIAGVDFLGSALHEVFGDEFTDAIAGIRNALVDNKDDINTFAMSESSKVLNDMAMISRTEDFDSEFSIRETHEYLVGNGWIEILAKEAFVKYFAWCNRKGFKPLYTTAEGFISSLSKSPAIEDSRCFESKLRGQSMSRVCRLSLEKLTAEGVDTFKTKPVA